MRNIFMRSAGLWHHRDFAKLWTGQTISLLGSQVTFLALPLTAVLVLGATPAQMGLLTAAGALPSLLVGLFAGVWVDRHRRQPILIAADLGRAALLFAVPAAALLQVLRMEHLYLIAFLVGLLGLFFDVAYRSYLPSLVGREHLVEGNSKLEMSQSVAEIVGPGIAGWLAQAFTAPLAIAVDAVSFLVSAIFLRLVRAVEPAPRPLEPQQNIMREAIDGLHLVLDNRLLRAVAGCVGILNLFNSALEAVLILYLTRELQITPALLGLVMTGGSAGFLIGALLTSRVTERFGLGAGIIGGVLLAALSDLLIPLLDASAPIALIVLVLVVAQFFFGLGLTVYRVGQVSLRQAVTPDGMQGRMNATISVIAWGIVPLGGLIGGALGELIGTRSTLLLCASGELLATLWLLLSPVRALRQQPTIVG